MQVTGPSGEDTDAVLILEKTPFQEEKIEELLRKHTKLELQMANDIYSTYRLYPPPELSGECWAPERFPPGLWGPGACSHTAGGLQPSPCTLP